MFRDISEMIRNHVLILKQSSVNDSLKNLKCKSKTRTTVFNSDMARTRHILTHYVHLRNGNGESINSLCFLQPCSYEGSKLRMCSKSPAILNTHCLEPEAGSFQKCAQALPGLMACATASAHAVGSEPRL